MERSALGSFLILKVLSRSGTISTPSALLRHLNIAPLETTEIYTYFLTKLLSRPTETVKWAFNSLSWVSQAARPLREKEVACAAAISLAIELKVLSKLKEYISADAFADLDLYAGVFVKKENDCILPFHKTASEFLCSAGLAQGTSSESGIIHNHAELTKYCLDYISRIHPRRIHHRSGINRRAEGGNSLTPEHQFLSYACIFWPNHYSERQKNDSI